MKEYPNDSLLKKNQANIMVLNYNNKVNKAEIKSFIKNDWLLQWFYIYKLVENSKALKELKRSEIDDIKHHYIEYVLDAENLSKVQQLRVSINEKTQAFIISFLPISQKLGEYHSRVDELGRDSVQKRLKKIIPNSKGYVTEIEGDYSKI